MENIQFFKLKNGDDIVASVTENDESVILHRPIKLVMIPYEGKSSLMWTEYVSSQFCSNESFHINKSEILTRGVPTKNLERTYRSCVEQIEGYIEQDKAREAIQEIYEKGMEKMKDLSEEDVFGEMDANTEFEIFKNMGGKVN